MNIAVVGTGYVGLVSGTCLAETGNHVICVDIDQAKVELMQGGEVPIYEPNLDKLFLRNIEAGRLEFTTDLKAAVDHADIIFLALPTPPDEDGSADLSYVLGVADQLGNMMTSYKVVVDKSTVPVGTADKVKAAISANASVEFDVVANPEFLREGFAVDDFLKPDRIVVGCSGQRAKELMEELYKPYVRQGNPILFMDERSAELTKYAANSFLATKITFMNEVANFCEKVGADVDMIRMGMGTDNRIGHRFLFSGIGYGGSCFPKDVKALHKSGKEVGLDFQILDSVMSVNDAQKTIFLQPMKAHFGGSLQGIKVAMWGLSFKPETDDIREAPSLYMIDKLISEGAEVVAFDPEAMPNVQGRIGNSIQYAQQALDALDGADCLLICTEWAVFRNPDFAAMEARMKGKVIFDGRNLYNNAKMARAGWTYRSIGRPSLQPES
ncbi:MAG TPA: UDP-glucose 6-dehydrogenase [Flavobacteriales bacterium]|nr:UDP-glucose 6-dehydrogenase [Flavobacteriales bacterium]